MEQIIPERFIRMCRLLEINTFPIHWKFEEKDQQIVVTFIWNIVTSEILNPQKTVPKTESKSSESKTDPDKKQKHSASHRREPTKKDSACKSKIHTEEASNTDKRRSKSNSSSRSTSSTYSAEERKSVHKEKSVDDRLKDSKCKKTQTISCSKPNNPSDNVPVGIGRVKNEQSSDSKKIHQKSSSNHPSSNSEKKQTISSSKHATSDKEDCKVRLSSDTKHRHSSSSSEKSSSSCKNSKSCGDSTKQNSGSNPKVHIAADPETIACEKSRIPEPQKKVKHNETIGKGHSLRVDKACCESSSHGEKRHSKSSSQDHKEHTESSSRHEEEKKDPRSRCDKTNNDAISQSEKTHKKLYARCEKTEKVPCSRENSQKDSRCEKTLRVSPSRCEKTEKDSSSQCEEIQKYSQSQCEKSQKTSNPQGGETSKVLKCDQTPKDASVGCVKIIKKSQREQTIIEPSSRKEETLKKSQIKQTLIGPSGEKAHKDAKCDKTSKVSASKCDKSHNERCERTTTKQSLHCKQSFQKSKNSENETPTDSQCDRTIIKDANSECEQKLKETSLQSEQTVNEHKESQCEQALKELDLQREKTVQESVPKCDLTPKDSSSRCEKTINDIDKNTPSSGSKIKSKKETTHSSQDSSKDSRKSDVNTNRAKSKDATVKSSNKVTVSSKPKETTDSSSSGLSKGKRRKDVIEGEQPKKPKIDTSKDIPSPSSEACIPKKLSNSVGSPQSETPSEESSIEASHQIPKQPCIKESVSSDIPLESTTILSKIDLWQMFVSRCKVKTDVNFANQAEKEPIVQHCPVDPEPAVKADQNTKSRQSTEHIKLPHKEDKSKRDRKSTSDNKVHKKGSTTRSKSTNTSKSKRSSNPSSEKTPNSKESSKKPIEKNLPASGPSDNTKLTPVSRPKGTSLRLEKIPKECTPEKKCTNTESVNEVKASREEYDVPNNDRPQEPHHDGHGLSDDDEDYNQLKIDLEQFESKASGCEDEEVLKEKEESQTQTNVTLIQFQKSNPEISVSPSELKFDSHPSENMTDPTLDRADNEKETISEETNTSIEGIESVKDLTLVPASSNQKTAPEAKVRKGKNTILSTEPKQICRKGLGKDAMCSNELLDEEVYRNNIEEEDVHKNKRMEGERELHRNNLDDSVLFNEQEEKDLHSSKQIVGEMYNNEQDEEKTKSNKPEGMTIDSNELEEGEIGDDGNLESREAVERNDNNLPTYSPVSSIDAQIDDGPLEVIESNGPHETVSRNQVENRTEATIKPQTDGIRSPSSIYSFLTGDVDDASRPSTPLLDEPKVSKETNINTQILPKTECLRDKECSQVKSQVVIPRRRKRGKRKKNYKSTENKTNERNWPTSLADILQDKRLSKGKRSRLLKKLRKELLELPDSSHEDIKGKIRKEQKKLWKVNHDAKLWIEPKSQGHQETSCRSEEYVSDWDNLLQQHISQMKRPKSKDSTTENLDMKIDNFLIEMDLSDNKRCPSTFLPPNQTYKENINSTIPSCKVPKKVNLGNLIDVQSYTSVINDKSSDDREQFDHDSLMDSIIISSTYQDENREETHKKRKRHTLDLDSDSEAESDPESRKSQRSISRRLPRMNRDIAIKQRTNPDTGIHQYLFLYEDSRPCTWVDSDEIKDYNPHFYNSLKKCFVPKEDSQEKSELQQKLYSLVGFPP